jgi:hypothetical protein
MWRLNIISPDRCIGAAVYRHGAVVQIRSNVDIVLAFFSIGISLPPLHNLGAHFDKSGLGFAFGEEGYRLDGLVDVLLS